MLLAPGVGITVSDVGGRVVSGRMDLVRMCLGRMGLGRMDLTRMDIGPISLVGGGDSPFESLFRIWCSVPRDDRLPQDRPSLLAVRARLRRGDEKLSWRSAIAVMIAASVALWALIGWAAWRLL